LQLGAVEWLLVQLEKEFHHGSICFDPGSILVPVPTLIFGRDWESLPRGRTARLLLSRLPGATAKLLSGQPAALREAVGPD